MTDHGGGPVPYILHHPCPPGSGQLSLSIPELVLQTVSHEQRVKLAAIQTIFAQRVSALLAQSYEEVAAVIRVGDGQKS